MLSSLTLLLFRAGQTPKFGAKPAISSRVPSFHLTLARIQELARIKPQHLAESDQATQRQAPTVLHTLHRPCRQVCGTVQLFRGEASGATLQRHLFRDHRVRLRYQVILVHASSVPLRAGCRSEFAEYAVDGVSAESGEGVDAVDGYAGGVCGADEFVSAFVVGAPVFEVSYCLLRVGGHVSNDTCQGFRNRVDCIVWSMYRLEQHRKPSPQEKPMTTIYALAPIAFDRRGNILHCDVTDNYDTCGNVIATTAGEAIRFLNGTGRGPATRGCGENHKAGRAYRTIAHHYTVSDDYRRVRPMFWTISEDGLIREVWSVTRKTMVFSQGTSENRPNWAALRRAELDARTA